MAYCYANFTQGPVSFKNGDRVGITQVEQLRGSVDNVLLNLKKKSI